MTGTCWSAGVPGSGARGWVGCWVPGCWGVGHVPLQQDDELVEWPAGLVERDRITEQAAERPGVAAERPNVDRDARGHGDHKVKPVRRNQQQVAGLDVRYQDLGTGTVVNLTGLDCLVCARTATRF